MHTSDSGAYSKGRPFVPPRGVPLKILWCTVLAVVVVSQAAAQPVLLYDVDSGSPFHTVNQPPTYDTGPAPRRGPSGPLLDSLPRVVPAVSGLADQPLELSAPAFSASEGVQFELTGPGLPGTYPAYRLRYDLIIVRLDHSLASFAMIADTPTVSVITFDSNGNIKGPNHLPFSTFTFGEVMRLDMLYDVAGGRWALSINGETRGQGPFSATNFRSIRTGIGGANEPDTLGAIDNVRIHGLPAPAAWPLLTLGACCIRVRRR